MKKLLGISLVAIMSVSAANAEIASKAYVDQLDTAMGSRVTTVEGNITTLNANAQTEGSVAKKIADAIGDLGEGNDTVAEAISAVSTAAGNAVVANEAITAGTHTKITYDAKGLVTAGSDITLSDVTDVTATASEVNALHEAGAVKADFEKLHAITADATELNYVDGVTSAIQTQLNAKADSSFVGEIPAGAQATTIAGYIDEAVAGADGAMDTRVQALEGTVGDSTDGLVKDVADNAAAIAALGTMSAEDAANYKKTADLDSSTTATTGQVVTAISMTDGVLSQTTADPLTNANYQLQAAGGEAGKYALTAVYDGNTLTGYAWELIERASAQQGGGQQGGEEPSSGN